MTSWALFDGANALVGQVQIAGTASPSFAEAGFARAVKTDRQADPAFESINPTTGAITTDLPKLRALVMADLKTGAELRKMSNATPGGYKKTEYAAKQGELQRFDAMGTTLAAILSALSQLAVATQTARFPYAAASAARFGDTIPAAIERFRSGMNAAPLHPVIAATEEKACAAIRAATTAAAIHQIADDINWNTVG